MNKNEWISAKIAKLVGEGKPQQQAIAIAYSMWEQGGNKQEGGNHKLPMAQEAIIKRPKRLDGSNNMYANGASYNGFGQTINPMQGMGTAPFNSQAYGIPMGASFDSTQKGFYPTQGGVFPNSLTYGKAANPNYGKAVTATATSANNMNINPFAQVPIDQTWTQTPTTPQKSSKEVVGTNKKAGVPVVKKKPTSEEIEKFKKPDTSGYLNEEIVLPQKKEENSSRYESSLYGAMLTPYGEELRQQGVDANVDQTQEQKDFSNNILQDNNNENQDWIKYNILNPYGQGMDLNTSLAYTGQQFAKGNTGMGIAGAGLSALKGVKSFLSGYGSGKGQKTLEEQMYEKLYNSDENLYRGNRGVAQQGGEITNADLLTGNYIAQDGQQDPNIEIEGGEHVKNSQTGEVQEAVGEKHTEGGISVNLPDQSKVLSDYTKIGNENVKTFEDTFGIKLKASDTFATVLDKYNNKIGVKKLEEEEKELIKKVEKNAKSSIDIKTKQVNEDFLAQEIAKVTNKKEGLNKAKAEAFETIFKEQEKIPKKGDGTQILDKSGKPMAQQGGVVDDNIRELAQQYGTSPENILQILQEGNIKQEGGEQQTQEQPDPQQIIQAYAQMAGQDPNQVIQQLQQMPPEEQQAALQQMMAALQQGQQSGQEEQAEGQMSNPAEEGQEQPMMLEGGDYDPNKPYGKDWTKADKKLRYESALQQARLLGYDGKLTKNDFEKDSAWGELQKYVLEKRPAEVEQYAKDTRLTAKHIRDIKATDPSIFKSLGISIDKPNAGYSEEESQLLSAAAKNSTKLPKTFWTEGFNDNLGAYRFPMMGIRLEAKGIVKGAQAQIAAPNMNRYFSAPEEPVVEKSVVEDTPVDVKTGKPTSKEPTRNILSTEGMPYIIPPSAPLAPYLQQASLSRLEGQKGSVENQLQNSANSRQAAYESTRGLPPAQAAAMMANYLSTSGQQDTAGIAQQEVQDLQNKARIEQYNAGQADKEQLLNEQLKKQYEREAFGTLNVNEQNWRNYYDANQANQKALSDKIERRNIMNLGLTNYQLNGSGGFDFVNQSPFQNNTGDSNNVTDYSPENIKKWKEYLKNIEAQAQLAKKDK